MAAGLAASAAPAAAQDSEVDAITVYGRYGPDGPQTLSRAVPFSDLDLTTRWGQDELRHRIRVTAQDLCTQLNEPSRSPMASVVPSCRERAERDAISQMRRIVATAAYRPAW
ncbi:MAG TPA: UrcA family protein, partial [Phenylobacterium sp.]